MHPTNPQARQGVARVRMGFARADDGVQLHWRVVGSGPAIVCCNGVGVSTFFWKYLTDAFSGDHTVVLWDYRGHGRSQRDIDPVLSDMSIGRHADDLRAVLAEVDVGPAVLVGHSMGCQVALEARRRLPDQVAGIVLMLGTAGRALSTFFDFRYSPYLFRGANRMIQRLGAPVNQVVRPLLESPAAWHLAKRLELVDPYYATREDMTPYMQHLATLDFRLFIRSVLAIEEHDAWDLLPVLGRPMLVIAAENDKFTPMWCSRKIVRLTPGAEMLVLADASHAALVEQPETINRRIQRFFSDRQPWEALT